MKIKINKGLFGLKTKYLNEAILFAKDYRNSPGFNERWNRIGKIPGTYRTKNSVYNPLSQYEHKLLWKKGKFKKGKYIPWKEDSKNSMYKYDNGDFYIGTSKTPAKAFSNWKDMLTHEAGHYLEGSLNKPTLIYKDSSTTNSPLNFYSEIYPVFRKSNSYKNVLNSISGDKEDVSEYNRNPVIKSWSFNYDLGTNDLHDASPSESYADLFLLRKKLLDSGIYDSRKANNLFKQEHLDKFKKLNKDKIRLFDNFSDKDIIWMMNNIAQNNKILSTLLTYYAKKGGSIETDNARKWKHNKGGIFKAESGLKFYNTKLNYNPNIQPLFIKLIQPFVDNQRNPVVNLHVVRFNPETGDAENNVGEGYSLALPELTVYGDNMKEKMSHVPYQLPEPESTWALMGKHSKDAEKYWSPEYGWLVFNTMTLGAPNRLSVSLDLRFIKDLFNPKLTATQKADSWVLGNEGIFENPLYNMVLDMASGAGIEGAILHISSKPTLYRNLYRKGIKQLTAKKRLNNLIDKAQLLQSNINLMRRLYDEIVDKVTKELVPLVTRLSRDNPVNLNINPNKLKLVWQKIHPSDFSGEGIQVTNIDGKPTAYVVNQAYNPNTIVNTGKYRIPNFNTGEYIEGNLNLNSSDETITTAAGKIIPTGLGSRNILGVAPLRLVLNDNYNFVVQHIPGFKGFGSSVGVKEGALNHITHDIDGYISKENLDEFAKTHNINRGYSNDTFWYELNNGLYGDAGHIDLNVIDINPKTGVGNDRAKELYRQFFPKEYRHSVERSASDPNHEIYITDLNNVPLTNLQLIDKFDPLTKTIMDSFEIDFDGYNKAKHAGRALEYLAGDNPKAVRKALEQTAKELGLDGEMNALLPNMKFGNLDENIKILNQIGYKGDLATIAKDPEKMQNVLDYWALTKGKTFNRVFGPGNINEKVGTAKTLNRNAIEWNYTNKGSGGHSAGAFLNTIMGSEPINSYKYMSILVPHIDLPLGAKAKDIIDKVRYMNGASDMLIKDKSQLSEILQKSFKNTNIQLNILNTPNLTFQELLYKLPSEGKEVADFGKLFNLKFKVNAIQSDTLWKTNYGGVIAPMNNPKDSYSLFYKFHGLPSWDSRMQKFNNNNNANPFDILRRHLTEKFYIGMTRNRFKDINRENRYRELLHQIWDNQLIKHLKYNAATDILDKRIKMAKNKINDIAHKKKDTKNNIKIGLASTIPTGAASIAISNKDLNELDRYNLVNSPKYKAQRSYFNKMYDKAQTEEALDSIADLDKELYETLKDTYKQLKKLIDLAKAKIPRNKYGTPKFDSPEYLTWKRLLQIAIQEGYLPEDYVPDYNFE